MDAICSDCRDGKCHACVAWAYVEHPDGDLTEHQCTCTHEENK